MAARAWLVVDLGFGDAGKGSITDYLVRAAGARLVVRYNGGAQAGHNVVTPDGRHHTFSQLGSGTFVDGVHTHLAPTVVIHPTAAVVEAEHLRNVGVPDALARLTVADACRVTTPFHQAAGRLREVARGAEPHGTCGVGVGETVRDCLEHPGDALLARDLTRSDEALRRKLGRIRQRLVESLPPQTRRSPDPRAADEWRLLAHDGIDRRWIELIDPFRRKARVIPDEEVIEHGSTFEHDIVLEGAQGVLLDEHRGFHPHTSWSTCTTEWAERWLHGHGVPHRRVRLGVLRTYLTRHGPGPLPSEEPALNPLLPEPHNDEAGWQGSFRLGWPDPLLTRYAIEANGGVDALALTHLDRVARVPAWNAVAEYAGLGTEHVDRSSEVRLRVPTGDPLAGAARLTHALLACEARYEGLGTLGPDGYIDWIERTLGRPVWVRSQGPTAADKGGVQP